MPEAAKTFLYASPAAPPIGELRSKTHRESL
jgi:hypothetical protein